MSPLNRPITALAVILALAAPAAASGGIFCENDSANVDIALSHLIVINVLGAAITVGDHEFSTGPERGPGTPIISGQAFGDGDQMMFDFTDPNYEQILVSVRLKYVPNNEDYPWAGTVALADGKSVAIECGGD